MDTWPKHVRACASFFTSSCLSVLLSLPTQSPRTPSRPHLLELAKETCGDLNRQPGPKHVHAYACLLTFSCHSVLAHLVSPICPFPLDFPPSSSNPTTIHVATLERSNQQTHHRVFSSERVFIQARRVQPATAPSCTSFGRYLSNCFSSFDLHKSHPHGTHPSLWKVKSSSRVGGLHCLPRPRTLTQF